MSTQLTSRFIQLSPRVALIADVLKRHNLPAHHLRSTCQAIFQRHARSFDDITSLPRAVRLDLAREMSAMAPPRSEHVTADTVDDNEASGSTLTLRASHLQPSEQCVKTLLELHDGRSVEAVWMRFRGGQASGEVDNRGHSSKDKRNKDTVVGHRSLCISSQVGCALKCNFCATGFAGFKRQLTVDEIIDQVLYFTQQPDRPVDTISFMGMGEALQNPNVFRAIEIMTDPVLGMALAQRRLNVSTVGIIPGIRKLTERFPRVNLAFSLHSPFDEQRNVLVPTNKIYPLNECLKELERHALKTKRKPGFNDTRDHAAAIQRIITGMHPDARNLFHLNLLRYNPAEGAPVDYKRTQHSDMRKFLSYFAGGTRFSVTVRQSFGVDIDAACGQLYRVFSEKPDAVGPKKAVAS